MQRNFPDSYNCTRLMIDTLHSPLRGRSQTAPQPKADEASIEDWQRPRKKTIVIYTSDQGFFLGAHGLYDKRSMYAIPETTIRGRITVYGPKRRN